MDTRISDEKLLKLATSADVQSIALVAITLLELGEQRLLDFLNKYGEIRGYQGSGTLPVSSKVLRTGMHVRDIDEKAVYIKYNSNIENKTAYIYCGHYISVFSGKHNQIVRVIDFT